MTALDVVTEGRIVRRFSGTVEVEDDGRTIVGRYAPYDVVTDVADEGILYREVIRRGAFRKACRAPNRVPLTFGHSSDLGNEIARAVDLVEEEDGLYGTFRADASGLGDHGLAIIRSKAVTGLSVPRSSIRRDRNWSTGSSSVGFCSWNTSR